MRMRSAYLAHRAELVRILGPPLAAGDTVLDLACGDGGLATFLPDQRYLGVDASDEMVDCRPRARARARPGRPERLRPAAPVQATTIFRAIYYARDRRALFVQIARLHRAEARLRSQPAPVPACGRPRPICEAAGFDQLDDAPVLRAADACAAAVALRLLERAGRSRGSCSASASPSCAQLRAARKLREEAVVDLCAERSQVAEPRVDQSVGTNLLTMTTRAPKPRRGVRSQMTFVPRRFATVFLS